MSVNFQTAEALTVSAWDVIAFYERFGQSLDNLFHFDGVSVVETDATLYVDPDKRSQYYFMLPSLARDSIRDRLSRWLKCDHNEFKDWCKQCGARRF